MRAGMLERQRYRAAACTQVQHPGRARRRRQQCQRPVHQGFGVRPGNQHPRINRQRQTEKFLLAEQVSQRLTLA